MKGRKKTFADTYINHVPLYSIWCGIKTRCYNAKAANYKYYGAKGIVMCDEWKNDFMVFYKWAINNGWQPGLTIDRYPNGKGNYEPSNCRIATMKQQAGNRSHENMANNFKGINEKRRLERLG